MVHSLLNNIISLITIGAFLILPVTANNEEDARIITNLEIIYGSYGVPVRYWYNETTAKNDTQLGSVPGCPKSIDGFPWVYYGNPPRCYLAGHHGPCPIEEKMILQRGSLYGICACECLVENKESNQPLILPENARYLFCKKAAGLDFEAPQFGQVYDTKENKCYSMFEQGPCQKGMVITSWTSDSLECFPLCDQTIDEWWKMRDQGLCGQKPILPVFAGASISRGNECPADQRYSNVLKKCVRKLMGETIVG